MNNISESNSIIPSFQLEKSEEWSQFLSENGFVVIKNVLYEAEIKTATDLFWQWLESLGTGISRQNPSTWEQDNWPGLKGLGFFATYGGCHSKASWFIRCNHRVQQAFSTIWKTKQLISSFDTFIAWKPWWLSQKWKPCVQNLHIDQNPFFKKGLKCVQGMVPLKDVSTSKVGGLMVVPGSHKNEVQQEIIDRYPSVTNFSSDWVELRDNDPYIVKKRGVLVECKAGDLILWDSRLIHGGKICQPKEEEIKQELSKDLVRLSMTVSMLPRASASSEVLQLRLKAFEQKIGLTHWPNEFNKSGMGGFLSGLKTSVIRYDWPQLEGEVLNLV